MAVNLLFWNVRGTGNEPTVTRTKHLVKLHQISFIAVFEPIYWQWKKPNCLLEDLNLGFVSPTPIALFGYLLQLLHDSSQQVTVHIQHYLWLSVVQATCVFAKCNASGREDLWNELIDLENLNSDTRWIVGRDLF